MKLTSANSTEETGRSPHSVVPDDILQKYRQLTGQEFPDLERGQQGECLRAANYIRLYQGSARANRARSFRGSSNNHGKRYYRCATNVDFYAKQRSQKSDAPPPIAAGVEPVESSQTLLAPCPNQSLRAEVLEEQVAEVVSRLVIPTTWYEESLAYFISEEGMSEFERKRSNLAQGIYHAAELLKGGVITRAEFEAEKSRFEERLARLRPSVQPEAQRATPLLHDFAALWRQMTPAEHKGVLQCMLVGVYFDGLALKHIIANEPFDGLLGLI